MKQFLKCTPLYFLLSLIFNSTFAQTDYIGEQKNLTPHPRILMFQGEEKFVKKSFMKDAILGRTQEAIIQESDKIITLAPIQRIQIGRRLLDKSREALRRIFLLSYSYRTTNNQKYFIRAEKEMLAIAAFSDWNPSHFLDVAEMTMAVAIGYDWLHDELSLSSRAIISESILKKGLEPSLDPKNNSWLKVEHNWNQVCNAGMTYGAMAIYEDQPVLAKNIINRAIGSIPLSMLDYGPDGVYPEGYGYWGYGTSFNVLFLSAIEKLFGKDFALNQIPGFLKTAGFLENMTGPSGKPFNYSDAGSNGGFNPAMFWLANKVKDPTLLWAEKKYLVNKNNSALVKDRLLPSFMIWAAGISMDDIKAPKQNMWLGNGKNPVALMRSSWTDSNAIYLASKGGSVSINHAHMDIGSFVMESEGVRWAMDFGMQDYESLESKGIKLFGRTQDAERWTVFRLTNLVHNTLAIDSQHQLVTGHAPIIASSDEAGKMFSIMNLSEIYKGQVADAKRGLGIFNNQHVLVRDEIETLNKETTIRWTMLTPADVTILNDHQVLLTKEGKTLTLNFSQLANLKAKTWSTVPPNSFDAPNPGTTLVGFEVKVPANTKMAFNVSMVPGNNKGTDLNTIPALEYWKK